MKSEPLKVNQWSLVDRHYKTISPESNIKYLYGEREDGETIRSSRLISYGLITNYEMKVIGIFVKTKSGSEYTLCNVDVFYEKEFPNSIDKLIKSLPMD